MNKNNEELLTLRHSCEHVMHQAIVELFPGLKRAMGPATAEGFYLDFDYEGKVTEEDFPKIEKRMHEIIKANLPLIREEVSIEKAREMFKDNPYKLEWIDEAEKNDQKAIIYWAGEPGKSGSDYDFCKGPHVESTGKVGPFKLLSIAGAYWHGDEKNKMLTRIYGTCFPTQQELDDYLKMVEEAQKRDHKKLGPQLGIFMFHQTSPGMPYWLPNGTTIINELVKFWREEHEARGYKEIKSPLMNKKELYVTSGHWEHYKENMFIANTEEGEVYGVKPMNCPNAMVVYGTGIHSYRDLPLRLSDTDTLHRYERSGTLNGLLRVREFSQDDAHIFVTEDQIKDEYKRVFEIIELFYSIFNLEYSFRLGTRPEKYMGDLDSWNKAEKVLKEILDESGKPHVVLEGDGAFYGPKIDILMKDSLGRPWQMGTVQLDFQLPKNFELKYIDADGKEKTPVTIHRVIYGSLERFIGILIENFAGAFPAWLSPVQVQIVPITDRNNDYGQKVLEQLKSSNIRVELDDRSEKMQGKIRDAQIQKIPYMLVVGDREEKESKVAVRTRDGKDLGAITISEFKELILDKINKKSLELS